MPVTDVQRDLDNRTLTIVADFAAPRTLRHPPTRRYSRLMTALMYAFFRLVTGLPARTVAPPEVFL